MQKNKLINGETVVAFIGILVLVYLIVSGLYIKNKIYTDGVNKTRINSEMIKSSTWDFISSVLWYKYNEECEENTIISQQIVDDIESVFGKDTTKLCKSFDDAKEGKPSLILNIIRDYTKYYDDKVVVYRYGDSLYTMDDITHGVEVKLYDYKIHKELTDVSKSILSNTTPTFNIFKGCVYNSDGYLINFNPDTFKPDTFSGEYEPAFNGYMICAYYINWKRGIFGDNIKLPSGLSNPTVRQIIVLSKINIDETINNTEVSKKLSISSENSKKLSDIYSTNDKFNIVLMVCNLLIAIIIMITMLLYKELLHLNRNNYTKRKDDTQE